MYYNITVKIFGKKRFLNCYEIITFLQNILGVFEETFCMKKIHPRSLLTSSTWN